MAKTLEQYKQIAKDTYVSGRAAEGLPFDDPELWSIYSIKRLFVFICATMAFLIDSLFDVQVVDTEDRVQKTKPPTRFWYRDKTLNFQYGFPLKFESDEFDNTGYTDAEIAESKVVKHAALTKQINPYGRISLRIKTAGTTDGTDRVKLDDDVVNALIAYWDVSECAGDHVTISSGDPDKLKNKFRIKYNPLLITPEGDRIGGEAGVVRKAAESFLVDGMIFASTYVPTYHIDWLQEVPGIVDVQMESCSATYGFLPFTAVNDKYVPDAGYLKYYDPADLEIELVPNDIE